MRTQTLFRKNSHSNGDASGFSLSEILAVITILTILAAIAIPTMLSQRKKTTDASMVADSTAVSGSLEQVVSGWRNRPPAQVVISSPTTGKWQALQQGETNPAKTGTLSSGTSISGNMYINAAFCYKLTNSGSSNAVVYRSDTNVTVVGPSGSTNCPSAASLGGQDSLPAGDTVNRDLPATPTIFATGFTNSLSVTWGTVDGATKYIVTIPSSSQNTATGDAATADGATPSNQPSWTGTGTTVTFNNMLPGKVKATVRAVNSSGAGQPATSSVAVVAGTNMANNGQKVSGDASIAGSSTVSGNQTLNGSNNTINGNEYVSGFSLKDTQWINAAAYFNSGVGASWTDANYGNGITSFRKFPDGVVRMRGLIKTITGSGVVMTLPAGYRPVGRSWHQEDYSSSNTVSWTIGVDGTITVTGAPVNGWASVDQVSFDTN